MFLFGSIFIIQFFWVFFFVCVYVLGRYMSVQGTMLVYAKGSCGNTACHVFAYFLVCQMSPKQVWSQHLVTQEPSCFLSVTWHREGLEFQDMKALIPLGAIFLPSVAPTSQQNF
jgi:hypothetical protein